MYIEDLYRCGIRRRIVWEMVYLASKGCLNKVICEKHTFLNVLYRPTVRVSHTYVGGASTVDFRQWSTHQGSLRLDKPCVPKR